LIIVLNLNVFLGPFSNDLLQVWIGISLSMFIVAVVLGWISRFEWRMNRQSFHGETGWFPHFWFLFRAVANRKCPNSQIKSNTLINFSFIFYYYPANEVITFSLSTRLVVAAWCLVAVVFVNSYTSSLVSYLMAPKFLPVITTVKSLAESRDVQITVLKHTSVESILFVSNISRVLLILLYLRTKSF
jgi:hypothetical protein